MSPTYPVPSPATTLHLLPAPRPLRPPTHVYRFCERCGRQVSHHKGTGRPRPHLGRNGNQCGVAR